MLQGDNLRHGSEQLEVLRQRRRLNSLGAVMLSVKRRVHLPEGAAAKLKGASFRQLQVCFQPLSGRELVREALGICCLDGRALWQWQRG